MSRNMEHGMIERKREEKAVDNTVDKIAEEIAASSNESMHVMKKWKDMDQEPMSLSSR